MTTLLIVLSLGFITGLAAGIVSTCFYFLLYALYEMSEAGVWQGGNVHTDKYDE